MHATFVLKGKLMMTLAHFQLQVYFRVYDIEKIVRCTYKKEKIKKIENSVKEKSECGRCVRADFFALLWGLMGS